MQTLLTTLRNRARIPVLVVSLGSLIATSGPIAGADFYWDADLDVTGNNIDGTNLGGGGTWDLSAFQWWPVPAGALVQWPDTNADRAIFTQAFAAIPTLKSVTLGVPITANQLSFLRSGYSISAETLTLAGANAGLHANLGESATIASVIDGVDGLLKTGGGSIRLTNSSNSYTGTTTIANGTLIIDSAAALGGTGTVSILTNNNTPLNTSLIGFGGGSLVLDGTATGFTFARDVDFEGRGPIGDRGSAILSLGNNTLSGTLRSAISPLPLSPTATIRNSRINSVNGTLNLTGTVNSGGTAGTTFLSFGGINSAGVGDYSFGGTGTLTGTGSIEKSGAGTLFLNTLASNAGFTGTIRISASATGQQSTVRITDLLVGGNNVFGGNVATGASSVLDMSGGVLEIRSDSSLNFGKRVYQRTGTTTLFTGPAAGGSAINGTSTFGILHVASNTGFTFESRNGFGVTFTGNTTQENSNNNVTWTNNMGGTLLFTGNVWPNSDGSARTLTIAGTGNTTIAGSIVSTGAGVKTLSKTGAGTLTIQGVATSLNGPVLIGGGAITVTDFRSLGTSNTSVINIGSGTTAGSLIIGTATAGTAGGLTTSRVINLAGTTAVPSIYANQTGANPVIFNANFVSTGVGAKTLTLGGTSTVDNIINGIIPNAGESFTPSGNAASGVTVLALTSVTNLAIGQQVAGTGIQAGTTITGISGLDVTLSLPTTAARTTEAMTASTGGGAAVGLTKIGSGTWVLAGANSFTGATTVTNGTLKIRDTFSGSSRNVLSDTSAIGFVAGVANVGAAGGTFTYEGSAGSASQELVGPLSLVSGAGTVNVVAGLGGTANLTFASIGTTQTTTAPSTASTTITVGSTAGLVPGMRLNGGSAAATISSITNGTQFVVSAAQTILASAVLTFDRPNGGGTVNFSPGINANVILGSVPAIGFVNAYSYFQGGDFAYAPATVSATLRAPIYGTDPGFVTAGAALSLTNHNLVTGNTSTGAGTVLSLKISGNQTVTQTGLLTINTGANTSGGILVTGGTATITGTGVTTGGAADLIIRVNDGATLNLNAPITATTTGGLTKTGGGTLIIGATNAYTTGGSTNLHEGTIQLTTGGRLSANSVNFNMRQDTILDLNGISTSQTANTTSIGAFNGTGTVTNSSASAVTFAVGGGTTGGTGTWNGTINETNGRISVVKMGTTNSQTWNGISNYTGSTTIGVAGTGTTGSLTVAMLANIGVDSSIGRGDATSDATNAGSLVFGGSTGGLIYSGNVFDSGLVVNTVSASTNRLFTIAGTGATISSTVTNNNAIIWSNPGAILFQGAGVKAFRLGGTSAGDNTFNPQITNNGSDATTVTKVEAGQWNLGNSNNTYTGTTTISDGILALNDNGALPTNSPLALGTTTTAGILQMSGTLARNLTATPTAGTGTITWGGTTGGGGFAAHTTALTVTLNSGSGLTWGSGGFVGTGGTQALIFNSASALSEVTFTNAVDLGAAVRTITVNDNGNTGADFATVSGVLSGAGGGLLKNGTGILRVGNANTYTGVTEVQAGTLVVSSLGSSTGGGSSSVGLGGVAMGDTNAIQLGAGGNNAGLLQYVGAGETSDRKIRFNSTTGTSSTNQIHADGSGALILTNVANDMTAGAKTVVLRGSNTAGNMITSVLADNGGALSITVDGGATWILTGVNTFTGNLTGSGGALGIGNAAAVGAGTLVNSNGNIFAYGADRTITNALTLSNNATNGWLGDYSLTFNGANNLAAAANNVTTNNSIVAGKTLTFQGVTANGLTATRAWTIDGPGETVINGNFTTSTAFGVNISKNGDGTLTLGTSGAGSNWNQEGNSVDVDRGTLKFTANNAIPTLATSGGLTISPELATTDTATVDFNGTTQTINALTATSNGTLILDNTSSTAATFRFGANNSTVNFGSGVGTYTVQNTGSGALSLVKLGNTTTTFNSGITLAHKGITASEGGGVFNIASAVTATTGLRAIEASTLSLSGGLPNGDLVTSIEVGGGSVLSLLDGAGSQFENLTTLSLGNTGTGTVTLNLNVGDLTVAGDGLQTDTLTLLTTGTLNLGNTITFNLTDAGLNANTTYTLVNVVDGGLITGPLVAGDWIQGATPGGFDSFTWFVNNNVVQLTTGNLIVGDLYWRGVTDTTWNGNANNWSTDKAGTTPGASIPGQGTKVIFAYNGVGTGALTTTLEQNFKINALVFEAGTTTPSSVTINPGALTPSARLEIAPTLPADGITISTGGPAAVNIASNLKIGANQTWNITGASTLTLSGVLSGEADVTKSGAGKVIVTGAADPTFNAGQTTDFTVSAGTLEFTNLAAFGTLANSNLANFNLTGGAFYYNNAVSGTIVNALTLNGGTLSAGRAASVTAVTSTYSNTVNVSGNSFINLRDINSTAVATVANNITLSGVVSGTGSLTVTSDETVATLVGGNAEIGTFTINNAASSWTGDLIFESGTVDITAAASATVLPGDVTFDGFGRLIVRGVNGQSITRTSDTLTFTGNTIGEYLLDNTSGVLAADFVVNQNGQVNIGAGGTGASARFTLNDAATQLNIGGAVVLGGNSSISMDGGDADSFVTISGIISDGGLGYTLAINDDAGGWAVANDILRLTGANTFSGNISLAEGVLEFTTVTNAGGAASSLGQGTAISMTGGTLRFVGSSAQSTNRTITSATGAITLSANGATASDTITYAGAITIGPTGDGSQLVLTGAAGREGIITGGITQTGDTADMSVTGGTWTHQTGTTRIGDDMTVTGATTVLNLASGLFQVRDDITVTAGATLNLDSTGALSFGTATLSADATLNISNGGVVNLGANDAIVATDFDRLFIAQNAGGATAILNMGSFNLTTSRFILGERLADRNGIVNGTGTLTVTGGDIDLFEGTINANLASTGSGTFEKFGPGTVTLAGNNTGLASTGATIINEGTLTLDYTTSNTTKIRDASVLEMIGSNLILNGNASGASAQTVASFTVGTGGNNVITLNPGGAQTIVLNLNALTRALNSQDGTVRFNLPTGTQSATNGITTDTLNTIGTGTSAILGGWATVNDGTGVFFARNATNAADGNIVAANTTLQDTVASWLTGANISDSTGFTGTLGKDFTLNSLRFNAAAGSDLNLGAAGHLRLTSGGILVTDNVGGTPSITGGTLDTASFALPTATTELIVIQDSAATFEIGSNLHRAQNVTKSGTGTLLLSGTNTYTGYTEVQNGTLQLSGGNAVGDNSLVTLASNRNSTLQLLSDETIGRLQGGRRNDNSDYGMVDIGSNTLTINQSASTTYSGRFTGSGTIVLNSGNTGNLNMSGVSTGFTGEVVVSGGLFQLSGIGQINASSFTINKGGNLLLDNNGTTRIGTRILDTTSITLNSADGAFSGQTNVRGLAFRTDQDSGTANTETIGTLFVASGASYVSLEQQGGNNSRAIISASDFSRTNSATLDVRGRALGSNAGTGGQSQLKITDGANEVAFLATLVGGGGSIGGTAKNVSIIPWAIGQSLSGALAVTDMGNTFLSYVDNRGFVPLSLTSEFSTFGTAVSGDNVRESLTTNLTGISGATINSLILDNNNTAASTVNVTGTGAGQTLAVTSGAMLFTLNTAATASSAHSLVLGGFNDGISVGGTNEYVIHVVNPSSAATTATLTATIASSLISSADITKSGRGTLILNQTNTAGGGARKTTINEGTLEIADLDNIGGGTGGLVFAGGTLRLGAGFTDDLSTRTVSFLTGGATLNTNGNNLVFANSIGGGGAGGFTKIGTGNLTVNAAANYSGATSYTDGTLTIGLSNALPSGTVLTLNSGTTAATLDLNGFNQTLGGLNNTSSSALLTTQVVIDSGNTLTVNGAVLIGADAAASTTLFSATGGGSFVQNQAGGTFQLGGGTGAANTNQAVADFSALANFTVDLGNTGVFRVGDNNANASGSPATNSTLTLAGTSNTITAGILGIGDGQGQGGTATLELGGGTNTINADTVYIGAATPSSRSSGALVFDGVGGSLTLRGSAGGTSRANVAMTTANIGTGFNQVNTFLTANHSVDLKIGTFLMSERNAGTGSVTSTFDFNTGTLDITNLIMSRRSGAGTGDSTSTVTISGGTATIGSIDMASSTGTWSGSGPTSDSFATLNISAGTVSIGDGLNTGTAINMANAATNLGGTANINLTGGNVNVTGDIIRTGGAGTENATVTLNGATLDMNGNDIGSGAANINFVAQSGTLENLGELNGGAALTKTTVGTLILEGTNTYTGNTVVSGGTLQLGSGSTTGTMNTASAISVTSGATFAVNQSDTVDQGTDFTATAISGDGAFAQTGSGTTILDAANTYTGGTTVSDGVLLANNTTGSATGTGAVTVQNGGTVSGFGSISGNTTIESGGTVTAGFDGGSDRTLNFGGDLTAQSGSIWLVDLVEDSSGVTDHINVTGNLSISGAIFTVGNFANSHTPTNSYVIATYGGNLTGEFDFGGAWLNNTERTLDGGQYLINYGGGSNSFITLTAVPEPGTFGLLGLALAGLGFLRFRKRRKEAVAAVDGAGE